MKPLSRIGLVFVAVVVVFLMGVPAKAGSITYTFTGLDFLTGTNFTYDSPSGFLSFVPLGSPSLTPTTASDLIDSGTDFGPLTGFQFVAPQGILFVTGGGSLVLLMDNPFPLNILITQGLILQGRSIGALGIAATTPAPEPSSLVLLATGLGALIILSRRKPRPISCLG
jgi:hypothetical protein